MNKREALAISIGETAEIMEFYLQHQKDTTSHLDIQGLKMLVAGAMVVRYMNRQVKRLREAPVKPARKPSRRDMAAALEDG